MDVSSLSQTKKSNAQDDKFYDEKSSLLGREKIATEISHDSSTQKIVISVDDAIEEIGCGRFQYFVLLAAGLCFAADSMEVTLLSFLSAVLESDWELSAEQSATITSSVFAGATIGTLVLGPMGDRYGRRPIFLVAASIISLFGFATAFVNSFPALVAVRFLVGFGVGGLTVPFDILAEFLPTSNRGQYLLLIEYFWTAGSMSVPVLAYLTIGLGYSWHWFVFFCAIPCLVSAILGMFLVPESPRWLVSQGRNAEALDILRRAAEVNGIDSSELFPPNIVLKKECHEESSFAELLKPAHRRLNILLWGLWFALAFAYYGAILTTTRAFENDGDNNEDVSFDFRAIFISCSAEVIGTSLVILTVDSIGRIASQILFYSLGGMSVFLLCFWSTNKSVALLTLVAFSARVFEMSASCMTWVTTAEVLPTEIRTTGHSAANAVARFGGFLSPYIVESTISLPMVGTVLMAIHVIAVVSAWQLPETKGVDMGGTDDSTDTDTDSIDNDSDEEQEETIERKRKETI